jgi:hypothetical protein
MAQVLVTCPECGIRGELTYSDQEFDAPRDDCKHHLSPATCPSLRGPLIAASRMLDFLEWEVIMRDGALPPSPSIVQDQDAA